MLKIGDIEIHGKMALAPMAGVTDLAFRSICREKGAALTYTEMVSAKALVYQDSKTKTLLKLAENEHPSGAQIFGSEPDTMARGAQLAAAASGADFIDINMGCPVGKIARSGDGSALMKNPELAEEIIKAVVQAVDIPVTIKIRKGWDKGSINAVEFARMAENAGVSAITVHGRTRVQMYAGVADWDIIRDVKKNVKIPVIANGDVFTAQDAVRILSYTGADMAMVGRGVFGNPWLFMQCNAALNGDEIPPIPPLSERVDTAVRQFELAAEHKGEKIACLEARKQFCWYLKGVAHAGYVKQEIVKIQTLDEIHDIAQRIKRELS